MSTWTTQAGEPVEPGDLVAVGVLAHPDAVVRIAADAGDGRIHCVLMRGGSAEPGTSITVEETQLLIRVSQ